MWLRNPGSRYLSITSADGSTCVSASQTLKPFFVIRLLVASIATNYIHRHALRIVAWPAPSPRNCRRSSAYHANASTTHARRDGIEHRGLLGRVVERIDADRFGRRASPGRGP